LERGRSFIAKVQKGFRVAIPKPFREATGIKEGDLVEVTLKKLGPGEEDERKAF
jgi:AbrB family looped-hinge helix DNA binding protein